MPLQTHPAGRTGWLLTPTALAVLLTLANAAKPVVVDDTAYLSFARHIAQHPADPYGFALFWYEVPYPAMLVLAPPVLPYWLALGINLFGENLVLLKLWLFPFLWLLARSLNALLHRFARGVERPALVLILFSPALISTVNFMLDVPSLALGLTAIELFLRARDRNCLGRAAAAGGVAGLAMQTKYTALIVPAVIVWASILHGTSSVMVKMFFRVPAFMPWIHVLRLTVVLPAVALMTSLVLFFGWECYLIERYGMSHFLVHLSGQSQDIPLLAFLQRRAFLISPFFGFFGALGTILALWAGRAVGFPRRLVAIAGIVSLIGVLLIVFLPFTRTNFTLTQLVWRSLGAGAFLTTILGLGVLIVKRVVRQGQTRWRLRWSRETLFLAGWLAIEVAGYYVLTPFPAGRRLIGVTVVSGLILARVVSRVRRAKPERKPPRWAVPAGVAAGILFTALDGYDAWVEKAAAEQAADVIRQHKYTGPVWFVGHWGFQYYAERAGMRHFVGRKDVVKPGEWLVLADYPSPHGFHRPTTGDESLWYRVTPDDADLVALPMVFDDPVSGRTVPTFYGGSEPIIGRVRPRLIMGVYRMKREWAPK